MSRIQVLPEILANKIAAGEIVERPASAVKELVENSLDAGARAIHVTVAAGGKRTLCVRDDGEGMSQDDALLAFEHHATSKLRTADDLAAITTLGFRGEALPSIASISRLRLRTRLAEDTTGTEIEIQGGVLRSVKTIPWDRGTEIEARDLFYNVPARRKFLRATDTEMGHIARLVTHYALAHPEVRFTLESDGRTIFDTTAVTDSKDRIYQVFGDGFLEALLAFDGQSGDMRAHGFTSLPEVQRSNAYAQYIYVNRRMVRDKVLLGAIRQAYRSYLPATAYPVTILFLELPFDAVDVNAHPAKTEIRFRDQNAVHRLTSETIDRTLKDNIAIPAYRHQSPLSSPETATLSPPEPPPPPMPATPHTGSDAYAGVADAGSAPWGLQAPIARGYAQPALRFPAPSGLSAAAPGISGALSQPRYDPAITRQALDMPLGPPAQSAPGRNARGGFDLTEARILGQMHDSYIIACDELGLLIVDQHVAHERILYEKIAAARRDSRVETQGLLIPLSLDLTPAQMALLVPAIPELRRNGFEVEPFGGASVLIRSVPALARDTDSRILLSEILDGAGAMNFDPESGENAPDVDKLRDRIAIKTACQAAIKVHTPLGQEKMRWLLDELARTRIPTNCPHGRPIMLRFSLYEIEKNFGRV